jgi:hypothetical protein
MNQSTKDVAPRGATKGTDQTIRGELQGIDEARLTSNALSWENVSVENVSLMAWAGNDRKMRHRVATSVSVLDIRVGCWCRFEWSALIGTFHA